MMRKRKMSYGEYSKMIIIGKTKKIKKTKMGVMNEHIVTNPRCMPCDIQMEFMDNALIVGVKVSKHISMGQLYVYLVANGIVMLKS